MSITLQLSTAFGAKRKAKHTPAAVRFLEAVAAQPARGASGQISAAPWEGLYLEPPEDSVDSTASRHRPNPDLERFLIALMYGE
jgi:hypothetical protein